jgi:hypothetical protein
VTCTRSSVSQVGEHGDGGSTVLQISVSRRGRVRVTTITKDANTDATIGDNAPITLSGALNVSAESDNTATGDVVGVAGSVFGSIAVMLSQAYVGAGTKAEMNGDVTGATTVTVSADGKNLADSQTIAAAIGAFAGAGTGSIEVTLCRRRCIGQRWSIGATRDLVKGLKNALSESDWGTGGPSTSVAIRPSRRRVQVSTAT